MCLVAAMDVALAASGALVASGRPAWQHDIGSALKRASRDPTAKYLQLGTVSRELRPRVRTVVFRGWLWETCTLTFVTDLRSAKADEIAHSAHGEACWYFAKARDQFRIEGSLALVSAAEADAKLARARTAAWTNLSDGAREQFFWPTPGAPVAEQGGAEPGDGTAAPIDPRDLAALTDAGERPEPPPPSPHFALLLLKPERVDQLTLSRPQRRRFHVPDAASPTGWAESAVNP